MGCGSSTTAKQDTNQTAKSDAAKAAAHVAKYVVYGREPAKDSLVFGLNGSVIELKSVDPTVKLAHWLREVAQQKGTKVGCGEGGCGACAVLLSRYDPAIGKVVSTSVNSCLKPLVAIHGHHITTVEGIGGPNHANGFHPIQKRFAQLNASQCGFCTPGFVVSVYSQLAKKADSKMIDIENGMDGNICRCTGYRPQMEAGKSFATDSDVKDQIGGEPIPNDQLSIQAEIDAMFPKELKEMTTPVESEYHGSDVVYHRAGSLTGIASFLSANPDARVVCAQTSVGVYTELLPKTKKVCDIGVVPELRVSEETKEGLVVGAATPISSFIGALMKAAEGKGGATEQTFKMLANTTLKIANVHLRDAASIGGNLSMSKELAFASDLATTISSVGTKVEYFEVQTGTPSTAAPTLKKELLYDFLQAPSKAGTVSVIVNVTIPYPAKNSFTGCYRTAIRLANAHAITNSSFHGTYNQSTGVIESFTAVYGCRGEFNVPGKNAPFKNAQMEQLAVGQKLDEKLAVTLGNQYRDDGFVLWTYKVAHRKRLVKAFFVDFLRDWNLHFQGQPIPVNTANRQPVVPHKATQKFTNENPSSEVGKPIPRPDGVHHAAGSAVYVSDIPEPKRCMHASWVISRIAKGKIKNIPAEEIMKMPGVHRYIGAEDLPSWCGNQTTSASKLFGFPGKYPGQEVFCTGEIVHYGQPIGLILADSSQHATAASKALSALVEFEEEKPIITVEQAKAAGQKVAFGRPCIKGNVIEMTFNCQDRQMEFDLHLASQKHFYMETHSVYAETDDRKTTVWVGTQFPLLVHTSVADCLGTTFSQVDVRMYRMGGSFGGKLPPIHACAVAVASKITGLPVKLHLDRKIDTMMQGGREETDAHFQVGYSNEGKIQEVEYEVFKAPGYYVDSAAVPLLLAMPRALFGPYDVPLQKGYLGCYSTNIAPRSWCRGPGEIESSLIQEELIDRIAADLGVHSQVIRERNLIKDGVLATNGLPPGMDVEEDPDPDADPEDQAGLLGMNPKLSVELTALLFVPSSAAEIAKESRLGKLISRISNKIRCKPQKTVDEGKWGSTAQKGEHVVPKDQWTLIPMYDKLMKEKGWQKKIDDSIAFNEQNKFVKRGVAVTPVVYHMYVLPATCLVNIYPDGSVLVHHGGTEMGQGLIIKCLQAANHQLSQLLGANLSMDLFHSAGNQTSTLPYMHATGASTGSENNVLAVLGACEVLVERLKPVVEEIKCSSDKTWDNVITMALARGINLSVQHNSTNEQKFEYPTFCFGAAEIELNVPTGEVHVKRIDIQYDSAKSLNPAVDIGQVEGAFMMGLGYMLQEDTHLNTETGAEEAVGTWEYKPPMVINVPEEFNVELHHNDNFKKGILSSKACGEPPLCIAPALTSAVHQAVQSARKDAGLEGFAPISIPFTPDKVGAACGGADLHL